MWVRVCGLAGCELGTGTGAKSASDDDVQGKLRLVTREVPLAVVCDAALLWTTHWFAQWMLGRVLEPAVLGSCSRKSSGWPFTACHSATVSNVTVA